MSLKYHVRPVERKKKGNIWVKLVNKVVWLQKKIYIYIFSSSEY